MDNDRLKELAGITEEIDDIPMQAINMIDDMLAALPEGQQYGTQGDVLRYILSKLQES